MLVNKLTFLCPSDQLDTLQVTEPSQTALRLSHFLSQCNQKAYGKHHTLDGHTKSSSVPRFTANIRVHTPVCFSSSVAPRSVFCNNKPLLQLMIRVTQGQESCCHSFK